MRCLAEHQEDFRPGRPAERSSAELHSYIARRAGTFEGGSKNDPFSLLQTAGPNPCTFTKRRHSPRTHMEIAAAKRASSKATSAQVRCQTSEGKLEEWGVTRGSSGSSNVINTHLLFRGRNETTHEDTPAVHPIFFEYLSKHRLRRFFGPHRKYGSSRTPAMGPARKREPSCLSQHLGLFRASSRHCARTAVGLGRREAAPAGSRL